MTVWWRVVEGKSQSLPHGGHFSSPYGKFAIYPPPPSTKKTTRLSLFSVKFNSFKDFPRNKYRRRMSVAPKISEFMNHLSKELIEKKGVAESTANAYIKTLYILNDKAPFKTLSFLRNKETISKKVNEYSASTQKSILASIVSVLSLVKDKPTYKSIHQYYYEQMMGKVKAPTEKDESDKTEKQMENWISWKEIQELVNTYRQKMLEYGAKKTITPNEFTHLLQYLVLSLYVYTQPRRNQDYLDMMVVKKWKEELPKDKNYLDLATSKFIFNKYKTSKKYGVQTNEIPNTTEAPLMDAIHTYLKFHPQFKATKGKEPVPFLITADGKALTAVNAITRILNKIFGKKVGSSMLRHIFLSDKYDIKEMEEDAEAMGHSVAEQRKYLRKEGGDIQVVELPMV
jgi:hypothetical protein